MPRSKHFIQTHQPANDHATHHHQTRRINIDLSSSESIVPVLCSLQPRADVLISTYHGGDYSLQIRIIVAAAGAGISRFMPDEFAHDSRNPAVTKHLPPHMERNRVIDFLSDQDEVEWAGLAAGYPIQDRLIAGHMGLDVTWQSGTIFGTGNEVFAASSSTFAGQVVTAALKHWDLVEGKYLCLHGLRLTLSELVAEIQHAQAKDWEIVHVEAEKCGQEAERRFAGGWPDAGMFLAERGLLADETAWKNFESGEPLRRALSLASEDLGSIVEGALHDAKHRTGGCGCD